MLKKIAFLFAPICAYSQPADFIPPEFRSYLKLTDVQIQQIQSNNTAYRQSQNANFRRVNDVNDEIGQETQKPSPDPGSLGLRYGEIESLCRQRETPRNGVYQQNTRVLTDEQRGLIRQLTDAEVQFRLLIAADALFLTSTSPFPAPSGFPTVFNGTPFRGSSIVGVISAFPIAPGLLPTGDVTPDLVAYLQLTSTQLEEIRVNTRGYQEFLSGRLARMSEVNQELQAEFAQDSPLSAALGDRYSEIESHRRQIAVRENELRRRNLAILTAEQSRRVQQLPTRTDFSFLSQFADRLNLVAPPRGRPASRPSGVSILVTFPGGAGSGSSGGFNLSAASSIYRTCLGGPEYEVRVAQFTLGSSE